MSRVVYNSQFKVSMAIKTCYKEKKFLYKMQDATFQSIIAQSYLLVPTYVCSVVIASTRKAFVRCELL